VGLRGLIGRARSAKHRATRRGQQHWAGRLVRNYLEDDADGLASMLAYAAMFSLLPILTVTFLVVTLMLRITSIHNEALDQIAADVPDSVREVSESMFSLTSDNQLLLGVIAIFTLLLGGGRLYNAMDRTCAHVFRAPKRSTVTRRLLTLVMMPLIPLLLLAATVVSATATALIALPLERLVDIHTSIEQAALAFLTSFLLAFSMLFLAYWRIPTRSPGARHAAEAAAVTAVLVVILAQFFPLYIELFAGGSLSGGVFAFSLLILLWLYLIGQIFVIGAEIAAFRSGYRDGPDVPASDAAN
jgi:membrane protein